VYIYFIGDSVDLRDVVIESGTIQPLLALIRDDTPITFTRTIVWAISNLCRGNNPTPSSNAIQELLPHLATLLNSIDTEVLTDTCWALSYVASGPNLNDLIKTKGTTCISCTRRY
jgi:importin subunit alpha-1